MKNDTINEGDSLEVVMLKKTIKLLRQQLEKSYDIIISQEMELNRRVEQS